MKITDIPHDKLLKIRWRDILEFHNWEEELDDIDYERRAPVVELVGRIKTIKRGLIIVETEWNLMKDFDDYKGESGSTQVMPIGCIESIHELKIGKKLYDNPDFREIAEEVTKKDAPEAS